MRQPPIIILATLTAWSSAAAATPTDRNLLLVYRLDAAIKQARAAGRIHRPLIIRFLAYHDVLAPPSRPLPADFDYDTCSATYFPIARSYVYAFEDGRSPRNAHYRRNLSGWVAEPDRLADLLRLDTTSTRHSSSHANAANAFEASRATRAVAHLERALGQEGSRK